MTEYQHSLFQAIAENIGHIPHKEIRLYLSAPDDYTNWEYYTELADCHNMFDAGIAHAKKQSQLAKVNKELLEACLEATCLFNDYPQCYESIGTHQVLHIAINNATKAASAPIGESS